MIHALYNIIVNDNNLIFNIIQVWVEISLADYVYKFRQRNIAVCILLKLY